MTTHLFSYQGGIGKITMNLKVGKHIYPVKGLITSLGATLLLISMAIDFSYGKMTFLTWLFSEAVFK